MLRSTAFVMSVVVSTLGLAMGAAPSWAQGTPATQAAASFTPAAVRANVAAFFAAFPNGGGALAAAVRNLLLQDPSLAGVFAQAVADGGLSPDQVAATGNGFGSAVAEFNRIANTTTDPAARQAALNNVATLQTSAAGINNAGFSTAFAATTGATDTAQTGQTGAGPGGPGPGPGPGGGGGGGPVGSDTTGGGTGGPTQGPGQQQAGGTAQTGTNLLSGGGGGGGLAAPAPGGGDASPRS